MVSIDFNEKIKKYQIKITEIFPDEFINIFNDAVKFIILIVVYNFMLISKDKKASSLSLTIEQILYVIIGLSVYWLIVNKLIEFK